MVDSWKVVTSMAISRVESILERLMRANSQGQGHRLLRHGGTTIACVLWLSSIVSREALSKSRESNVL